MAAANESQGLKIAVAVFVTLAVILAVATYFSYRSYADTDALLTKAKSDYSSLQTTNTNLASTVDALRKEIGVRSEDADAMKTEIKKEYDKVNAEINALVEQAKTSVAKAQSAGAQGPELEEAKQRVEQVAASYRNELNKNYISAVSRATELMKNLALLTNQVSLNYVDIKRSLEAANGVNAQKLSVAEKSFNDSKTDLTTEQQKHADERQNLLTKVDQYQTDNARQATEIANLTSKLRQTEEDFSKKLSLAQQTIREYRDRVERTENVLDRPDGRVTFVAYEKGEIQANISRSQGARPQMKLTIFDANSPGLPTDKPKGTVELVQVGDRSSIARIVKTNSNIDPIRVGDYVYSPAWSPNEPMRFALIGKIDINRDGKDDREDLKRMIEAAGGIVDYDLPPPEAGKESGKLSGRDAWYVVDTRPPFHDVYGNKPKITAGENAEFLKKQSEAIRDARLEGVRPMPIERLLPFLGYDYLAPVQGRAEAIDTQSMKRALAPRQETAASKPAAAQPEVETPKEKEEMPKEEPK
jgi:hypothetical protein